MAGRRRLAINKAVLTDSEVVTMTDVEWTNELSIRLLEAYKEKPELWDTTHCMYRVATAKYEAWTELANEFECDIVDLRRKLNSLFASHRREKSKIRNGGRSTWLLYPHMHFLPKHLPDDQERPEPEAVENPSMKSHAQPEPEYSEQSSEDEAEDEEDSYENVIQEEIIIKEEPVVETTVRTRKYKPTSNSKPRISKPVKKRLVKEVSNKLDCKLLEMLKLLRRSELSKKKDECDSFGEYIADSLRKHDDKTQCMIKQAINNILFEQEMKKYNSSSTLTLVLNGLDENPLKLMDDSDK